MLHHMYDVIGNVCGCTCANVQQFLFLCFQEVATKSSRIITKASHSASYEDETVDENTNDDYYDDEIFAEDTLRPQHDVQAEEGQHEQSPMTQYKWKNYGTRQALEESQRSSDYGNNDRSMRKIKYLNHKGKLRKSFKISLWDSAITQFKVAHAQYNCTQWKFQSRA